MGKKDVFALIACALLSCIYNRLNIYLSGTLDSIIFFPMFNGGVMLLATMLSICICKEKISFKRKAEMLLGVLAICVIGIF